MSEKLTAKQAAEQLLYKPEYAADKSTGVKKEAAAFAEGYKAFLNEKDCFYGQISFKHILLLKNGQKKTTVRVHRGSITDPVPRPSF